MRRLLTILRRCGFYVLVGALGFVVGMLTLYAILLQRGPELEPWHTARLDEEFTARRADDVHTLDDYLAIENRVLAQVDAEVYAKTEAGPGHALDRYSSGSSADPRGFPVNWNRTFELDVAQPVGGVLLLHGMSDSPYSLRALGESLHAHGYQVVGLRLPGHGTAPSGLATATWRDMAAAVRIAARHLARRVGEKPFHIVGYSNGATLALDYCLDVLDGSGNRMPRSLVLLSPAVGLSPVAALAKWQARLAFVPGFAKAAWTERPPEFDPFKYNSFAIQAAVQVYELTSAVAARIAARAANGGIEDLPPMLAAMSAADATVSADAVVDVLLSRLAPGRGELLLFDVNRALVLTNVMVDDPGPLTARLMADGSLPFAFSLITNANPESLDVVERRKSARSADVTTTPTGLAWPRGVLSLSHVALPFPPDDPLYGTRAPADSDRIYLGRIAVQGERGLLRFPPSWLVRLRHNPFFAVLENRTIEWIDTHDGGEGPRTEGR